MTKIALVTGGGLRIGKAVAKALADAGYAVAIHYNNSRDSAAALASRDYSRWRQGRDLRPRSGGYRRFSSACCSCGRADGRACISAHQLSLPLFRLKALDDLTPEQWQLMTNVNAAAPIFLMQAFARQAPAGAAVVNMLDTQLRAPSSRTFSYFCAKAALETATKVAALELAPKIRVNGVAPGLVLPSGDQTEAIFAERQGMTPLGEGLGVEDIADAVLYLASAHHITGEIITVDSGQHMVGFSNADLPWRSH